MFAGTGGRTTRLFWQHNNPLNGDGLITDPQGMTLGRITVDPTGVDLGDSDPFSTGGGSGDGGGDAGQIGIDAKVAQLIPGFGGPQVKLDGFLTSPYMAFSALSRGAAELAPPQTYVGIYSRSQGKYVGLARWNPAAARDGIAFLGKGSTGYVPVGVTYSPGEGFYGENVGRWFVNNGSTLALLSAGDNFLPLNQYVEFFPYNFNGVEPQNPGQPSPAPRGNFPCPPTGEQLTNNPYIDQGFQAANRYARSAGNRGFVEAGGWILLDRKGNLSYFIKPREDRDTSALVYGLGEPQSYIPNYRRGGDIVIADFHTHVNELSNPDEVGIANARGTPGIWIYPSGRAEAYGPNRGLRGRNLPKGCQ